MFLNDKIFITIVSILWIIIVVLLIAAKFINIELGIIFILIIFIIAYIIKTLQIESYLKSIQKSLIEIADNTKKSQK